MKKFRFPLDRLRAYRKIQFDTEQNRMQALLAESRRVEQRREALQQELEMARIPLREGGLLTAEELAAVGNFANYVDHQSRALGHLQRQIGHAIEQQRQNLLEARRAVEALDQLRGRRLNQWRAEADREQENLVAELVVARWKTAVR
jgi:flagellar export protein FliJ